MIGESFNCLVGSLLQGSDLTLVCSDGQLQINRLLLAGTIGFLGSLLEENQADLVYIQDASCMELQLLLRLLVGDTVVLGHLQRDNLDELADRLGFNHQLEVSTATVDQIKVSTATMNQMKDSTATRDQMKVSTVTRDQLEVSTMTRDQIKVSTATRDQKKVDFCPFLTKSLINLSKKQIFV